MDRDVKPLVSSLNTLLGDLKEPTHLSIGVGYNASVVVSDEGHMGEYILWMYRKCVTLNK